MGLRNNDNKIIMTGVLYVCNPHADERLVKVQDGFIPNRQLINNVVDADAMARIVGTSGASSNLPLLFAWDEKAACPSVAHKWLKINDCCDFLFLIQPPMLCII